MLDNCFSIICSQGMPELPSPLKPMRRRSISLERFPGPKEDLYTAVNKPTRKKPLSASTKGLKGGAYTKLSDINVNKPDQAQQSYSEVSLDQRPELEPNKRRESAVDDDMWVTIKWKQQQKEQRRDLEQSVEEDPEAVALSLLGGGGQQDAQAPPMMDYTNLEDINSGQVFVGEVKRADEDSNKIYIEGITDINNDFSIETHDYINHDTDENKAQQQEQQQSNGKASSKGDTYSEIEDVEEVVKFLDEKKKQKQNTLPAVPDTNDYINTEPPHSPTNLKVKCYTAYDTYWKCVQCSGVCVWVHMCGCTRMCACAACALWCACVCSVVCVCMYVCVYLSCYTVCMCVCICHVALLYYRTFLVEIITIKKSLKIWLHNSINHIMMNTKRIMLVHQNHFSLYYVNASQAEADNSRILSRTHLVAVVAVAIVVVN